MSIRSFKKLQSKMVAKNPTHQPQPGTRVFCDNSSEREKWVRHTCEEKLLGSGKTRNELWKSGSEESCDISISVLPEIMKDEAKQTHLVSGRKRIYLVPLFVAAVIVGFLVEVVVYELITPLQIRTTILRWGKQLTEKQEIIFPPSVKLLLESLESRNRNLDYSSDPSPSVAFPFPTTEDESSSNELWEQPTLLNLERFTWIYNNEKICKVGKSEDRRILPILVHTARSHFQERLVLRKTIGSLPPYKNWIVRLVFLLGEADRGYDPARNQKQFEEQEERLEEERSKYADVVLGNFIDSYHNLTLKHLMGYKWILNFCPEATFVLKIDDDVFIDILKWLDWRSKDLEEVELEYQTEGEYYEDLENNVPDLYCHTFMGTKPIRVKASKWYASKEDWPHEFYPSYCSGWSYGITVDLIRKLYSASNDVKVFWIDDVFATGILMEAAKKKFSFTPNVRHIWGHVTSDIEEYRPFCEKGSLDGKRLFHEVAYVPRGEFFERDMMCMFNKTLYDNGLKLVS